MPTAGASPEAEVRTGPIVCRRWRSGRPSVEQAVTPETPDNFGRVTTSTEPLPVQPPGVERVNWWWVTGVGTCLVSAVVDVATVDHGEPVVVWGWVPRWW